MKRVTDPLDDKVKARLVSWNRSQFSYSSSGSEHDGAVNDGDSSSPCLSHLVQRFFEEDDDHDRDAVSESCATHLNSERVDLEERFEENVINYELESSVSVSNSTDSVQNVLRFHVSKAIDVFACLRSNKLMFRRNVMSYLRNQGYNAAICKSKWEATGGLIAGSYEYIDVVTSSVQNRYIIDVDFAGEFEIARPTEQYSRTVRTVPSVYVGKADELKETVKVMCDSSKRSLKSKGLQFPPWRKKRYMMMKWFGPYRRSTNLIPASLSVTAPVLQMTVKCRYVGFDTNVNGRYFTHT